MKLTDKELSKVAEIIYDTTAIHSCSIFDGKGTPICRTWRDLSLWEKETAKRGLKERIEREGLIGYLERKKREVPEATPIYERIIGRLKREGLLK